MKHLNRILLLFVVSTLVSCNNSKKENNTLTAHESHEVKTKSSSALTFKIDVANSTTTYIGSKPTGQHHGKIAISEGNFGVENSQIVGGKVVLDMNRISVDDLGDGDEAQGKSILINHLRSKDFLDSSNHPTGEFNITSIKTYDSGFTKSSKKEFDSKFKPLSNSENSVQNPTHLMTGNLTLRGVSKSISFPVKVKNYKTKIRVEGKFNIDRTVWNIKYGEEASVTDKIKDKFIYNTVNLGFYVEALNPTSSAQDYTLAPKTIDVFEKKFGIHEGKRRNHISGFCFTGHLTLKDSEIKDLTTSEIFSEKSLKVLGRFSHKGGVKKDESVHGEYGMAFQVNLEDDSIHNFSMNTLDFFPVSTSEGFLQLMQAKVSGKDDDFGKLKEDHPEFKNFKAHYGAKSKVLKNYANHQFNSVNSFYLENKEGKKTAIRWAFIPKNEMIQVDTSKEVDFYNDLNKLLNKKGKLVWDMVITIANPNDAINDAAIMWTGKHKTIVAATLTIDGIMKEGSCDAKNFDPLQLQKGILASDDPILKFRSPAYATAFVRRMQENKHK